MKTNKSLCTYRQFVRFQNIHILLIPDRYLLDLFYFIVDKTNPENHKLLSLVLRIQKSPQKDM